jgi:uncharacterized protein YegL
MKEFTPQYHNNPSQRTPCMLVLDASGSMDETVRATGRKRIDELNEGLALLQKELLNDDTAAQRVQLAIVCVGGPAGSADLLMDWTDAVDFQAPRLAAGGLTPLGEGMRLALRHVEEQKRRLQANGVGYTRPWVMVISDGEPTDDPAVWQAVTQECRSAEANKRCVIYPIGVADANMAALQQLSSTPVLRLSEARFREYFQWLSSSLSSMSRSRPGEQVQLAAPSPWTVVSS